MYYGADYYPEHWPQERWAVDAQLMKEAHINVVRLAEFAWAKMEPNEGEYDFTWLDQAITVLAQADIQVILGTPTATPPKWLMDKHPSIYPVDSFGRVRGFGSRRHYCYNNPTYQAYTVRIVEAMVSHFQDHPQVVAWQIDNEFGCHDTTRCYCAHCHEAFHGWLQAKYGDVESLNQAWGTVFWSQTYRTFAEVILPAYTLCDTNTWSRYTHNPGLLLDFYRFSSDSAVNYQQIQLDCLRKFVKQPITHNLMGHFDQIDYFDLAADLDVVCWDNYPVFTGSASTVAMAHDLMRGVKDQNFWVMEQQSGPLGWNTLSDTPQPGQLRLWAYQAVAHGAEALVYFRWRACPFGTEQYWYGILDHDGVPRRRYREIQQIGQEMATLSEWIVDSTVVADTALIKSYDNLWSHQFQPHSPDFDYNSVLLDYYQALTKHSLTVDVTGLWHELADYKLVVMPAFNLMTENIQEQLTDYVTQGGTLLVTFRSGTRNWDNSMTTDTLPGYFRELAGVEVEEFDALNRHRQVPVAGITGRASARLWCDILKPIDAKVLATYTDVFYANAPAITEHTVGAGRVVYVGCHLEATALADLVSFVAWGAGVKPALPVTTPGVEVVQKAKLDGTTYLLLLNHNSHSVILDIPASYKEELISRSAVQGRLVLGAYDVKMIVG